MNKKISMGAFFFFSVAWVLDFSGSNDISGIMNVGLMWLALAAVIGEEHNTNKV